MRNTFLLVLLVALFGLLQGSFFFDVLRIEGVKPDLPLILVTFVAFKAGSTEGELTGFASGLFQQFFSTALFGMYAFMYTVVGFVVGFVQKKVYAENFLTSMLLVLGATLVKGAALAFLALFFGEAAFEFGRYLKNAFLLELVYNAVLAAPVFWVLNRFTAPALD